MSTTMIPARGVELQVMGAGRGRLRVDMRADRQELSVNELCAVAGDCMRAAARLSAANGDAKRYSDALTWLERNTPDGLRLVSLALSEVTRDDS